MPHFFRDRAAMPSLAGWHAGATELVEARVRGEAWAAQTGDLLSQTETGWARLCLLAVRFGWEPSSTSLDEPDWPGLYTVGCGRQVDPDDARALAAALRRALRETAGVPVADYDEEMGDSGRQFDDWRAELDADAVAQAESLRLLMTADGRSDVAACARFCERGAFTID